MDSDIEKFYEMIADCYAVFVGTKRTIEIAKEAFTYAGVKPNTNTVFYEIESTKKTEKKLALVTDKKLKIEILKEKKILV